MLRPGADMGKAQFAKQSGYSALGIDDAKALLNHPLQIDPQSRRVWRSIPPIFAASERFMPS